MEKKITIQQALDYDIRGNWLASYLSFEWAQSLMSKYMVYKVRRKYKRYEFSKNFEVVLKSK